MWILGNVSKMKWDMSRVNGSNLKMVSLATVARFIFVAHTMSLGRWFHKSTTRIVKKFLRKTIVHIVSLILVYPPPPPPPNTCRCYSLVDNQPCIHHEGISRLLLYLRAHSCNTYWEVPVAEAFPRRCDIILVALRWTLSIVKQSFLYNGV